MPDTPRMTLHTLPMDKLLPGSPPRPDKSYYRRLAASLKTLGLLHPLIVYPQDDGFAIVDGHLRYEILLGMGVETVPCHVLPILPPDQEQSHA